MTQQDLDELREMCATGAYHLVSRLLKEREMLLTACKAVCVDDTSNPVAIRAKTLEAIEYAEGSHE